MKNNFFKHTILLLQCNDGNMEYRTDYNTIMEQY